LQEQSAGPPGQCLGGPAAARPDGVPPGAGWPAGAGGQVRGDDLAALYGTLAPKVLGYLRAHGAEDPEGLTSEVFVQVVARLDDLDGGEAGLRTFVFSVAHARLVDDHRRRARRPVEAPYEPHQDARQEPSAEAAALRDEGERRVHDALRELSEEQRTVITLRVLGDLSLDQTADVLGKSVGAVKQLQRRGLHALRRRVERGEVAL
jgi:RNA polymerase sigma-70 factor (ECF subfamily)